ncbi:MAG: sensor histidine kinase [Chloroflexi bacterium]|nr:sensor histidine kinase [Chloroflexota bacterium]
MSLGQWLSMSVDRSVSLSRQPGTSRGLSALRSSAFWQAQAMVVLVTLLNFVMETAMIDTDLDQLHYLVPILYTFPIFFSHLQLGRNWAYATALTSVLAAVPDVFILTLPGEPPTWPLESLQLSFGVIMGLTLASQHERFTARLKHQNEIIHETNLRLIAKNREAQETAARAQELSSILTVTSKRVRQAQEEERRRIARDLHDTTVQRLVLMCREMDKVAAAPRLPRTAFRSLEELRSLAEEVLADVRRFCRELRPSVLDDLGVVAASESLGRDLERRSGIAVRVDVRGCQRRLPPDTELALFRIVQESLHNVEKHSGASLAMVTFAFEEGRFQLDVRDNGRGFNPPTCLKSLPHIGKLGLAGMQERAELVGAALKLDSRASDGARVTVTIGC